MLRNKITPEELREYLSYNPETGTFLWKNRKGRKPGDIAGCAAKGYWFIGLQSTVYKASRLAWLYMTGTWPQHEIDHINGDSLDDRWENLRDAPHNSNMRNRRINKNSKLQLKGVYTSHGRYQASISFEKKRLHLGTFDSPEEAKDAYDAASTRLFGQFARGT